MRGIPIEIIYVSHNGKHVKGKACTVCGEKKPLDEFYWYHTAGRYSGKCKPCERAKYRAYHAAHREEENAKSSAYWKEKRRREKELKGVLK